VRVIKIIRYKIKQNSKATNPFGAALQAPGAC